MIVNVGLILVGFVLLIKGADFLVSGASGVAKKFHIPEIIIGLTIVSMGTSMPELFVSVTSACKGYSDMTMGNVIGSNVCNLLLILGLSATIRSIKFKRETKLIEIPMCLAITIIFWILCNIGVGISKVDAIILVVLFIAFIGYTIYMSKKGEEFDGIEETKDETKQRKTVVNIIYILLGIVALKYGGDFVVKHAEIIAKHFNISEKIIGLTIVAIGTSLGSNIFNILFIIGLTGLISPINYNVSYNIEMAILAASTVVLALFPYTDKKDEMTTSNGITYLMLYALYMVILFVK